MGDLNKHQFEQYLADFEKETGVQLYGSHAVVGNRAIPTVRTQLFTRKHITDSGVTQQYYLEAQVPGREGNLHSMNIHTYGGRPFYGMALSENARGENLDTHSIEEFSQGVDKHLESAASKPPSKKRGEHEIMSEQAAVDNQLDEWHRRGKLRTVEVVDWDNDEDSTKTYDPMTGKYL